MIHGFSHIFPIFTGDVPAPHGFVHHPGGHLPCRIFWAHGHDALHHGRHQFITDQLAGADLGSMAMCKPKETQVAV